MAADWWVFEQDCPELIRQCLPNDEFRVAVQRVSTYADGVTKRMDIHVAERRPGGRHYVIDCKHWPVAFLNEAEIQTTIEYKIRSRASKAIILISQSSNCPDTFIKSAERQGVPVIRVRKSANNTWFGSFRQIMHDFFFNKEIRRQIR